jgi:hypothetical protein
MPGSKPKAIAFAAKSSSSTTRPTPLPPKQPFFTAIAVAQQEKARSFELRAALSRD